LLFNNLSIPSNSHHGAIHEVKKGALRLAQIILGASHLTQVAIPAVLSPPTESDQLAVATWKNQLRAMIQNQAHILCSLLNECYGLEVIHPQGAIYAIVKIYVDMFDDSIADDVTFMSLLLEEENIVVLPGQAFGMTSDSFRDSNCHVFRVVFCAPEFVIRSAAERISLFCLRHRRIGK